MKLKIILLVFCVISVKASDNIRLPDIRSFALGVNGVVTSAFSNPAVMELTVNKTVGAEYFNRYLLKELGSSTAYFFYPNSFLSAGIQISSFGFEEYRMNMARCLLSKRISKKWHIGIGFQYFHLNTELYDENPTRFSTDVGIVYKPFDNLLIGLSAKDVPSLNIKANDLSINDFKSYLIQIGINWKVINNILITSSYDIDENNKLQAGFGVEYVVFDSFQLRAGIQTNPFLPCFGTGFNLKHFNIDVAAVWHPELGISSGIGLSYFF